MDFSFSILDYKFFEKQEPVLLTSVFPMPGILAVPMEDYKLKQKIEKNVLQISVKKKQSTKGTDCL